MIPENIFREYDIRGLVDEEITPQVTALIGKSFGTAAVEKKVRRVIVGCDARISSPELKDALIEGVLSTGAGVIDIGMVPTPIVYFGAYKTGCGTALMLTASHNPPQYNGVKMMLKGHTLYGREIRDIYQSSIQGNWTTGRGSLSREDIVQDYFHAIASHIRLQKPLKVVVDCANGIPGAFAPALLRKIGCEVVELYCDVDGTFPNHPADPTRSENLADLIDAVRQTRSDVGLALDGDGDRVVSVSGDGEVISPDRLMILFVRDILRNHPGRHILYDVKCTRLLPKEVNQSCGNAMMWKTGHSLMKAKARKTDAVFGGEMSGHYFFRDRWPGFDDGIYGGARLCELLSGSDPVEMFRSLPDCASSGELRFFAADAHSLVSMFQEHAQFDDAAQVSSIDGIRVDFSFGFGLLRASNTAPEAVMRFEADSETQLQAIRRRFDDELKKLKKLDAAIDLSGFELD